MDAIILAGALNTGLLRAVSAARYEAEIEIAGKPMVEYVITALNSVSLINRIVLVGAKAAFSREEAQNLILVDPGDSLVESLINGLNSLKPTEPVLVVTSDIPLITMEALEDFIKRCLQVKGDLYYSFVSKSSNEAKYPGVRRTYVRLKEGVFTGGNLVLLSERVVLNHQGTLKKVAALRKKPLRLCSMLGWDYFFKFIIGQLTIDQIETRISEAIKLKAVGIISPFPEVGVDIDKPSDWELAQRVLSKK